MPEHLLAIDLGTQSVRAAVFLADGKCLALSQQEQAVETPGPHLAEQAPAHWWKLVCQCSRQALESAGIAGDDIAAVAVCGQMHAPVGINRQGELVTPRVQLWCDKRCLPQCERIVNGVSGDELQRLAANPPLPCWMGFKVRWLKDNDGKTYREIDTFLTPKDFINFLLTGTRAIDTTEASGTYLMDPDTCQWSGRLADLLGVDLAKFPEIKRSYEVVGETIARAKEAGLPQGIPVVAGGGDFPISMLGVGLTRTGQASEITGTSSQLAVLSDQPLRAPQVFNLCHPLSSWLSFTIVESGGASLAWMRSLLESILDSKLDYDALTELASRAPAGSDGLLFYPFLMGERRRDNANARGAFVGLTPSHRAPHLVRAVMEGTTLALRSFLSEVEKQALRVSEMRAIGGGAKNIFWQEIRASIYNLPLLEPENPEGGLLGSMFLAAKGAGLIADVADHARQVVKITRQTNPNPEWVRVYQDTFADYQKLYERMLGYWEPNLKS